MISEYPCYVFSNQDGPQVLGDLENPEEYIYNILNPPKEIEFLQREKVIEDEAYLERMAENPDVDPIKFNPSVINDWSKVVASKNKRIQHL